MIKYRFDTKHINDWDSFHSYFSTVCEFPDYYGCNMNAWIDCVTDLGDENGLVLFELKNMSSLKERCPELYSAIIDSASFVNFRFIEAGGEPFLMLSYE